MAASSSRGRSSSPFSNRKPSTPYSSTSSSSLMMSGRLMPRSCSSSATSFYSAGRYGSRSMASNRSGGDFSRSRTTVAHPSMELHLIGEPAERASRFGDSIAVTIRFRPLSEREYQRGDEIAWYTDGEKIVRNEYNPWRHMRLEVYEVAARPVVKAAMEGVNGTVFAYAVTSRGRTHTMHTPGREFLLECHILKSTMR